MTLPEYWVNGQRGGSLQVNDRGFSYGDGAFETLRVHRGRLHLLERHLARLALACDALDITFERARIEQQLQQVLDYLDEHSVEHAALRLALSRGEGERGYSGSCGAPTIAISVSPQQAWREAAAPCDIIICETSLASQPALAGLKHSNRLEQVLAAREVAAAGKGEGLMLNQRGEAICCVAANIFVVFDDCVVTPPIGDCGVRGTVRELLLEQAASAGIAIREQLFSCADLPQAQEMFLTNSLLGVRSVARCGVQRFTSTRWGDTLRSHFFEWCESSRT